MLQRISRERPVSPPVAEHPTSVPSARERARGLDFAAGETMFTPESPPLQADTGRLDPRGAHAAAARGLAGASAALPHAEAIQRSFGRHEIGAVQAQVGGSAREACAELGSSAYASGGAVAFASAPDLHTAAHEAAHVVQQRAGVQLSGGVGASGDVYERHADQVADAVVAGRSAEGLLDAHAGSGGGAAVQLYQDSSTDYTTHKDEKSGTSMFMNQLVDPRVLGEGMDRKVGYDRETLDHPDMRFADDDTLGVQATSRVDPLKKGGEKEMTHAKELYAAEAQVADSNRRLENVGSFVRLVPTGHSIERRGKTLLGVKPCLPQDLVQKHATELVDLKTSLCIEVAQGVMGSNKNTSSYGMHAVLNDGEGQRYAKLGHSGKESVEVNRLGQALGKSGGEGSGSSMLREMSGTDVPKNPGDDYGKRAGKGELDEEAKKLGINEHARPEIGEGYATYTMGASRGDKGVFDFSAMLEEEPIERERIWGYHFAGVVAKSADGRDDVTLENFNRDTDLKLAKAELLRQLKSEYEELLGDVEDYNHDDPFQQDPLKEVYRRLHQGKQQGNQLATRAYEQAAKSDASSGAWYFAMYGSNEGQTFHEQSASSGYFANPLTLRVSTEINEPVVRYADELSKSLPTIPEGFGDEPWAKGLAGDVKGLKEATRLMTTRAEIRPRMRAAHNELAAVVVPKIWDSLVRGVKGLGIKVGAAPKTFGGLAMAASKLAVDATERQQSVWGFNAGDKKERCGVVAKKATAIEDWALEMNNVLVGSLGRLPEK